MYLNSLKIQNVNNFNFRKTAAKKQKFFILLEDRYFVKGGPIDMNVCVPWETSVGFLKLQSNNFSQTIAKVIPILMSKMPQSSASF